MSILAVGLRDLRKIQLGPESTPGTAVAATAVYRAPAPGVEDQRELTLVEEQLGYLSGWDRTYIAKLLAGYPMDSHPASFQQINYLFDAGIKTVSGSADGGGSDYIYTYTFPTTAQNTIKTYTIEGGDNIQAEEIEHAFVSDFTISGEAGAAVMASANWVGRQATNVSFTGALTPPTVETMLASKGKLFIDAIGGTVGSTQFSNKLLSFELAVTTGWQPVFTIDGNLYFTGIKCVMPEILLTVTMEHHADSQTEKTNWRNETSRLIQLLIEGSAFGTGGAQYDNHSLVLDMAGKWDSFDILGEQDGNDVITGTFRSRYNATSTSFAEFALVNELSAIP